MFQKSQPGSGQIELEKGIHSEMSTFFSAFSASSSAHPAA